MDLKGIMIGTADSKKLSDYYSKLFGPPAFAQDDWYSYQIGAGALTIGPHSDVKGKNDSPGRLMFVLECQDVKAEAEKLKNNGAEVVAEPYQPPMADDKTWLATFSDPDGNYFQLMTPWEEAK